MRSWQFFNPVRVHFGCGCWDLLSDLIAGRRYCLVTYPDAVFAQWAEELAARAGRPLAVIDDVAPNPDYARLEQQVARLKTLPAAPAIYVALGGGSVIDSAKVFAAASGDFARVRTYLETGKGGDGLGATPLIAVPTTAGTGSEVTSWATVWDETTGSKFSLARPTLYPEHALIDPTLMRGKPRGLTIATGLDALSHALESLWNVNANPVSANFAVAAADEILEILPALADDLDNMQLRTRMARAALFAGFAFSNTKTAIAHSLSYPLTLRHKVQHGIACSFSLPRVMMSAAGASEDCDRALAEIFGADLTAGARRLSQFLKGLGVSVDPSDHGVPDGEWREIVEGALEGERGQNFIVPHERAIEGLCRPI